LYVDNDHGNSLTPLDPRTGRRKGPDIPVTDPYNLYFTSDGRYAIVVAEAWQRLDFRDPHTMALVKSVPMPCRGVDHMDFTAEGVIPTDAGAHGLYPSRDARFLYITNRSAGTISVMEFATRRIVATWRIPGGSPDMGGVSADGKVLWLSGRHNAAVYAISTVD